MRQPRWHARVDFAQSGRGRGSGFLVDSQHVLTCAHVVVDQDEAMVTFMAPGYDRLPATIVERGPWRQAGVGDVGDVAVLRLDEPVDLEPAVFAPMSATEIYNGQPLSAFGFPRGHADSGVIATFTAIPYPRLGNRGCQLKTVDDFGVRLEQGFSGAAVYLEETQQVLGMIQSAVSGSGPRIGVMLPTEELCRHWKPMAGLVPLGPFDPVAYRKLREVLEPVSLAPIEVSRLHAQVLSYHTTGLAPRTPDRLGTVLAVAESLATEPNVSTPEVHRMLGDLLLMVGQQYEEHRDALFEWVGRHLWEKDVPTPSPSAGALGGQASIVVRIAPTAADRETCQLTLWTVTGVEGDLDEPVFDDRLPFADIRDRVERWLPEAVARIPVACEPIVIEFVLPRGWLSLPVDEWTASFDDGVQLGWATPVVVRDLDWFNHQDPRELMVRLARLRSRSGDLDQIMRWRDCSKPLGSPLGFKAWLRKGDKVLVLGLAGGWASSDRVTSAVASGLPVLLWQRHGCEEHPDGADQGCAGVQFRHEIAERLRGIQLDALLSWIREVRLDAGDDDSHCGRRLTLLWDDPRRRPQPLAFAE